MFTGTDLASNMLALEERFLLTEPFTERKA